MKIKPLFDRIIIKKEEDKAQTASGFILPESAQEKNEIGKVFKIGDDVEHVKEGDRVLFAKYAFDEITVEGGSYIILKEENILAILK